MAAQECEHLLHLIASELRVAMALTGVRSVAEIDRSALANPALEQR